MKTVEFIELGSADVLKVVNRDIPQPKNNEVVVKIKAAGLNRAEELFFQGQYLFQPQLPSKIGLEASGIIESVGKGIIGFKIGDEVCLTPNVNIVEYGFIGEYAVAPIQAIITKPKDISYKEAASVWMTYGTAYSCLVIRGGLKKNEGQTVLISAASSGVGIAAIQMAKKYGAKVIATTRTGEKKDFLMAQGADLVIATDEDDFVEKVNRFTTGKGFDIAIDAIADSAFFKSLIDAAGFEATIVVYGALALNPEPSFTLFPLLMKGINIVGLHYVFHVLEIESRFEEMKKEVLQGIDDGTYKPVIDSAFSLDEVDKAYSYMGTNRQKGKIVIEI